jgi:hypothetical protein
MNPNLDRVPAGTSLAFILALATIGSAGLAVAQEWTPYASPEEGFSVEAPGAPRLAHKDFDPKIMAATRDHAWPKPSGDGAYLVTVTFRNRTDMAATTAEAALRRTIDDAKRSCEELRNQTDVAVAGGVGTEFVVDKCPGGMSLKARVHAIDERIVAVGVVGPSGVDLAPDTQRFLDSMKLTTVVPAEWKTYAVAQDGFSVDLPGTPTIKDGGFNPNTFTGGRVHEAETRSAHYAVTAAVRRRDGMTLVPNEQLLTVLLQSMKGDCELSEQRLAMPGGIGADFVNDKCPNGSMLRGRFILVDDRLYQLIAAAPAGMPEAADLNRLFDSFRLILTAAPPPPIAAPPAAPAVVPDAALWAAIKDSKTPAQFEDFLKRFPKSQHAMTARMQLGLLKGQQALAVPAATPSGRIPQLQKPAPASGDWGAIAIDLGESDPSYGIGGGDSETKAVNNAMRFCRQAGGKACKIVVTFNECAAYAAARQNGASGKGASKKAAEAQALAACNNSRCRIVASDCN